MYSQYTDNIQTKKEEVIIYKYRKIGQQVERYNRRQYKKNRVYRL